MDFPAIYLLHGMGGSPIGTVFKLETELRKCQPTQNYIRPLLPHSDPNVMPLESVVHLRELHPAEGSLLVGVSLGGLVAAKLQELERPDLHVICISSPTHAAETELLKRMEHRIALYSHADDAIAGRTDNWRELAEAYDLPWLTHDTDMHMAVLVPILCGYLERGLVE